MKNASVSCENGYLQIDKTGYYPVRVPHCTLQLKNETPLALVPASNGSYISAVHCRGIDALAQDVKIDKDKEEVDIYVYSALNESEISEYRLMQDGSMLAVSTTGKFTVSPKKIAKGKPLSIRITRKDGTKCTKIKTNIVIEDMSNIPGENFSVADKISFDIPDDVPLIGGNPVSFDFNSLPVYCERKDDKFRIGIGCTVDAPNGREIMDKL